MTDAARRILLGILLLGVIGISAELLLLSHTEDASQWIPLVLNDVTVVMSAVVLFKPSSATIRLFQIVMLLMIVSGGSACICICRRTWSSSSRWTPTLSGLGAVEEVHRRQSSAGAGAGRDDATRADWISLYVQASGVSRAEALAEAL